MTLAVLDRWANTGVQWVRLRDGATEPITGGAHAFDPNAKPKPAGLVCVDPTQMANVAGGAVTHYVAKIPWSSIEPQRGVYDWSSIDNLLTQYPNASMTLRIQAGGTTPSWAYTLSGGSVTVYNTPSASSVNIAYVWTNAFLQAWDEMITAAGQRYDGSFGGSNQSPYANHVVMVSADGTMCKFSEPYIIGDSTATSGLAIASAMGVPATSAGEAAATKLWTDAIRTCVSSTCTAFPSTRVELTIHSKLQTPTPLSQGYNASWPAGRTLALSLASTYGRQLVLSDYGLSDTDTLAVHTPTGTIDTEPDEYAWMYLRTQGNYSYSGPVTFQATIRGTSSPTATQLVNFANNAAALGGWHAEHSGWAPLSATQAQQCDATLTANATNGV